MAKVKMQIDLTKPRPRHVCVGLHKDDDTIGIWQPAKYEISFSIVNIASTKDTT